MQIERSVCVPRRSELALRRSPARAVHNFPLPNTLEAAILAPSPREFGECRFLSRCLVAVHEMIAYKGGSHQSIDGYHIPRPTGQHRTKDRIETDIPRIPWGWAPGSPL